MVTCSLVRKKILVTGFGFIGRHVVPALVEDGCQVTVLERKPELPELAFLGADPIVGDVRDAELLNAVIPEFDGVIHLAGLLGTSELVDDPVPGISTNITGAVNVFQACRRTKHLGRRVPCVHITAANHFMNNTYSITKHASDRFAEMFNAEHGTDIRLVRAQNVYGEHQKHYPVQKIVPKFVRAALRDEPLRIYGSGEQIQDMIHAGDVARILLATLFAPANPGLVSAGTGRRISVNEVAAIVIRTAGSASQVEHVPMRRGEPATSVVLGDPSTLVPIGIDPATLLSFEDGIRRTFEWYRSRPSFLD